MSSVGGRVGRGSASTTFPVSTVALSATVRTVSVEREPDRVLIRMDVLMGFDEPELAPRVRRDWDPRVGHGHTTWYMGEGEKITEWVTSVSHSGIHPLIRTNYYSVL